MKAKDKQSAGTSDAALKQGLLKRITTAAVLIGLLIGGLALYESNELSEVSKPAPEPLPKLATGQLRTGALSPAPGAMPPATTPAESVLPMPTVPASAKSEPVPAAPEVPPATPALVPPATVAGKTSMTKPEPSPSSGPTPVPGQTGGVTAPRNAAPQAGNAAPGNGAKAAPATAVAAVVRAAASPGPALTPVLPRATAPSVVPVPAASVAPSHVEPAPRAEPVAPVPRPVAAPVAAVVGYLVNLPKASELVEAEVLRARLLEQGIPSRIEARVQVGPFKSRAEAEAARVRLGQMGIAPGQVVRFGGN